jgi:hypothetical protein
MACLSSWVAHLEQADLAEVDVREGVAHEGIKPGLVDLHVENRAASGGHGHGLDALLEPRHVAVHLGAVEDLADDVEVGIECRSSHSW